MYSGKILTFILVWELRPGQYAEPVEGTVVLENIKRENTNMSPEKMNKSNFTI